MADYTTISRQAPFIEAAQENFIDLLTQQVGRAPGSQITDAQGNVIGTVPTLAQLGPQVATQNALTQAAQQSAATQAGLGQITFDSEGAISGVGTGSGVAGYQPFLDAASQLSGPQAFQQFMSPYQQQVIDTTLTEFDRQTAKGVPQLAANAIQAGAFGGGREGVAAAEYASQAAQDRAALQARLLGEGFTQAQNLAQTAFNQQRGLASLQPSLAATTTQSLGAAGTGDLAYRQAILDAAQQRSQLAYQEPLTRIQALGSGIASQVGGVPFSTTRTDLGPAGGGVGPLSQALSAGLSAYGLGSIFGGRGR